jgi:hypothetical protein
MPYHIRKLPGKDLYKVYGKDGKPHSKEGLSNERAKKQLTALNIAQSKEYIKMPIDEYKKEHIRLINVLTKHGALHEARKQSMEAAKELGISI